MTLLIAITLMLAIGLSITLVLQYITAVAVKRDANLTPIVWIIAALWALFYTPTN